MNGERRFGGFDHVDMRVASLAAVETFYDALAERLGLPVKTRAFVDEHGRWHEATPERSNVVEYFERAVTGRPPAFFGVIEEPGAQPARSRVAFAVPREDLPWWETELHAIGACDVEPSGDELYPAVFFEDPLGTRLAVCARPSRTASS